MRMPALYIGHGAPILLDDPVWTGELRAWAATLPKPKAILIVSAHWEAAPLAIGATATVPLFYDFYGFPQRFYEQQYAAPGAPDLAADVRALVSDIESVVDQPNRGLDHGAYIPLSVMYPDADIPVLQISMPSLEPERLYRIGQRLQTLRDNGVLVIGSGFLTHGLPFLNWGAGLYQDAPSWSAEFDDWANRALQRGDVDTLLNFRETAPALRYAHPTVEHLAPMYVTLGAATKADEAVDSTIEGFWLGLSKRSFAVA